jgi:hypothetical protein
MKPLKKGYFKHAMKHFREENENPKIAFLYISDDMEWGKNQFQGKKKYKNVFFVGIV